MLIEALGWAAAAIGSLVALPQVVKLFQTGAAAGVSLTMWQASFGANIAWTVHGVLGGYTNLWVPNAIFFCCTTLILLQIQRDRRLSWWKLLLPGLALAGGPSRWTCWPVRWHSRLPPCCRLCWPRWPSCTPF